MFHFMSILTQLQLHGLACARAEAFRAVLTCVRLQNIRRAEGCRAAALKLDARYERELSLLASVAAGQPQN